VVFRLLGPLEAGDERESLALGPRKQRALLVCLLLDAGRSVSVERLVDDLWGDGPPESAVKMVQIYVSGLRKTVGADRLLTRPGGYCFQLGAGDEIDLQQFDRLTADGRAALGAGDPATAARCLTEALGLWRGPALAEFASEPFARAEVDRLEELRLAAVEDRIAADLGLGRASAVVGELEALTWRYPLREQPRELLMRALYQAGRQGDALAAYHDFRGVLDAQLGLGPSPRLRALEQAMLTHAPELERPAPVAARASIELEAPPGRACELEALRSALDAVVGGARRLVMVCGEPGIGKTTLVEALLAGAREQIVIRGQCVDLRGAGEAYLPLLEGLAHAARDEAVGATLARRAPSWASELPGIRADAPAGGAHSATPQRMLREIVEALEALSADRPVVLVIEDLQWADLSTRDVLTALIRRRHPARLLVIVTSSVHDPLVGELSLRAPAQLLTLEPLDASAAAAAFELEASEAAELVRRAGGNPLFMEHLVEHLRVTGTLDGVPASLRAALQVRVTDREPQELELLQAAAVEGREFTLAGLTAGLGRPPDGVATGSVVEPRGTADWPDGTHTTVYAFRHALFRDVVLETIPPPRRAELHRRLGERLETAFGTGPEMIQAIALHHAEGRRPAPAVRFLRLAAGQCVARRAYREAVGHLSRALDAAADLPDGPLRQRLVTELLSDLGQAHVALEGWSSRDAAACLERARETAETLSDQEPLASIALALATLYEVRGEPEPALEAVEAGGAAAQRGVEGAELLACALFHQGAFARALDHADRGVGAAAEPDGHYTTFPATFGDNASVACHDWAALSLWFLGSAGESIQRARRALELSQEPDRDYSAASARAQMAALHACRAEPDPALHWAQATIDAARDRGYAYRLAMGRVLRGWAWAAQGRPDGVQEIACGLRASRETGARLEDPFYLALLADAHLRGGDVEAGLAAVEEGLETSARERARYYDAELHRLRGELIAARGDAEAAENSLRQAVSVAHEQGARSLELRGAIALARLLEGGDRAAEARAQLAVVHEPLAEEDTPDTRAAAALLAGDDDAGAPFERRRITVLAWEIDRIEDFAHDLDPGVLAGILRRCHAAARAAADGEGGHVATEDETGGLIYFGYPRALEDGPLRAVRAGRRLTETTTDAPGTVLVRLRVGIDTGPAVVGRLGSAGLAMGQTPATSWRLAAAAAAGDVVVSEATRTSCEGFYTFAAAGDAYRVSGATGARSRLEARGGELSPLVGREHELALLRGRWEQAEQGLGQAVFVAGEAGIGKSRLVSELAAGLDVPDGGLLEFQCSPVGGSSALHPVADHFRRALADRSRGLEDLLAETGIPVAHAAPVVAAILGVAGPVEVDPEALKRRTTDVVIGYLLARAERQPVLAVFEDLHWADPTTLDLFEELLDSIVDGRVLLIATFRPAFRVPWEPRSHASSLALSPCTPDEVDQLIANTAAAPLPPDVARAVAQRSDGIPLFIEELARAAGTGGSEIPATLADLLMARLDVHGPAARAVAQVASLIGREFPRDLLQAASGLTEREVELGLEKLIAAELLRRRGRALPVRYAFRHALLQEGVSRSLGDNARRALHLQIARALERAVRDIARHEPESVAHHFEAAGEPGRAVSYRLEAGRLALARSANVEAADQLMRAIGDLSAFPDGESREDLELDLRILLGNALISLRGYASDEVAECYARAHELCRRVGDDARVLPVLYGLWVNAFVRARHERVLDLGLELRELAERRDPGVLIVAERAVGWPLVCMGRFAEGRDHLDRILELHEPAEQRPLRFLYGQDPAVAGIATGAWALWGCGLDAEADARAEHAIALARELEHPITLTYALGAGALLGALRGDAEGARRRAVEAIGVTEAFRFPVWHAWSLYALGWVQVAEGDGERAITTLRAGLAAARATGTSLFDPFALATLSEAEWSSGLDAEASRSLAAAGEAMRRSGERLWEPLVRRAHERRGVEAG
jgi:predicted ATPase/DNA-binding SARP family transcriptional activator